MFIKSQQWIVWSNAILTDRYRFEEKIFSSLKKVGYGKERTKKLIRRLQERMNDNKKSKVGNWYFIFSH